MSASGRQLATYDCFSELPQNAPSWVELIEAKGQEFLPPKKAEPLLPPASATSKVTALDTINA